MEYHSSLTCGTVTVASKRGLLLHLRHARLCYDDFLQLLPQFGLDSTPPISIGSDEGYCCLLLHYIKAIHDRRGIYQSARLATQCLRVCAVDELFTSYLV